MFAAVGAPVAGSSGCGSARSASTTCRAGDVRPLTAGRGSQRSGAAAARATPARIVAPSGSATRAGHAAARLRPATGRGLVVALDGPGRAARARGRRGRGRGSGYRFCDTGLLYRALTWLALERRRLAGRRRGARRRSPTASRLAPDDRTGASPRPASTARTSPADVHGRAWTARVRGGQGAAGPRGAAAAPARPGRPTAGSSWPAATSARWCCPTRTSSLPRRLGGGARPPPGRGARPRPRRRRRREIGARSSARRDAHRHRAAPSRPLDRGRRRRRPLGPTATSFEETVAMPWSRPSDAARRDRERSTTPGRTGRGGRWRLADEPVTLIRPHRWPSSAASCGRCFVHVRIEGLEQPCRGRAPSIVACNHVSNADPPSSAARWLTRRRSVAADLLARQAGAVRVAAHRLGSALHGGVHPVDPAQPTWRRSAPRKRVLDAGHVLVVFPEGTRSPTGELQEAKDGRRDPRHADRRADPARRGRPARDRVWPRGRSSRRHPGGTVTRAGRRGRSPSRRRRPRIDRGDRPRRHRHRRRSWAASPSSSPRHRGAYADARSRTAAGADR